MTLEVQTIRIDGLAAAFRRIGSGPPVLFLHGWPFHGASWEPVAERLSKEFACFLPDSPGLGETEWTSRTDFSTRGLARWTQRFADAVGLDRFAIVAHDTGATTARLVAADAPKRVSALVLTNTEIPGHRPPWIPLHQRACALPGSALAFQTMLRSSRFRRSSMGYGNCVHDPRSLDGAFVDTYVTPLVRSRTRMLGAIHYLRGIDWGVVDALDDIHRRIEAPTAFVWGAEDKTFPLARARGMTGSLKAFRGLTEVRDAAFLVHTERPQAVADAALPILRDGAR